MTAGLRSGEAAGFMIQPHPERGKGKKEKRGKGKRARQRSLDVGGELLFEGCRGDEYGGGKVVGGVV